MCGAPMISPATQPVVAKKGEKKIGGKTDIAGDGGRVYAAAADRLFRLAVGQLFRCDLSVFAAFLFLPVFFFSFL